MDFKTGEALTSEWDTEQPNSRLKTLNEYYNTLLSLCHFIHGLQLQFLFRDLT